jgi:hypothetical protein
MSNYNDFDIFSSPAVSTSQDVSFITSVGSVGSAKCGMRDARQVLNNLFANSQGISKTGFRVDHEKRHSKVYTRANYMRDLALFTLFIVELVEGADIETFDLADTVAAVIDCQLFKSVFVFRVFRAFPLQEVEDSASNTCPNGYCFFNASLQCEMRDTFGMSIAELREFDREQNRQESLVPHIDKFIELVQPVDPKTRTFAQGKLKSTRYQAVTFPTGTNPFSTWGNGMFLPFLNFTIMLIDFQLVEPVLFNDIECLFGCLARVNHALSGTLVEDAIPQFSYLALMNMCEKVNYMSLRNMHFCILENPVDEVESAHEAVCEWAGQVVEGVMALSSDEIARVRSFANHLSSKSSDISLNTSTTTTISRSSIDEVVDLISDDEEDSISNRKAPLNSEFNFDVNVPPSVAQREMMLNTVRVT